MEKWKWLFIGLGVGVIMTLAIGEAVILFVQEVVERPAAFEPGLPPITEPEPDPIQEPVVEPEPTLVWKAQLPLYVIGGQVPVRGLRDLHMELEQLFDGRVSLLGGYPLVTGVEGHLEMIRRSNTIFLISPSELEGLKELGEKYPELLPLPYNELRLHLPPFMYVARDKETDMIRVLIIAHQIPDSLVKLLIEGVPLETPLNLQ